MIVTQTITLETYEIEEALLDYVNKHSKGKFTSLNNITLVNGTLKESICVTGFEFEVGFD